MSEVFFALNMSTFEKKIKAAYYNLSAPSVQICRVGNAEMKCIHLSDSNYLIKKLLPKVVVHLNNRCDWLF